MLFLSILDHFKALRKGVGYPDLSGSTTKKNLYVSSLNAFGIFINTF